MSIHVRLPYRPPGALASLRDLLASFPRVVLVLAAGDLVASFGFSLFFPFLTIYLVEDMGAAASEAGLAVAAYSLFSVGSGIAGGWLADRVGRRPVLIGSVSMAAVLVASMALASEVWHVALIMVLLGCVDPAFLPAARAAVADSVEEARRPRAFALLGVVSAIGWIAGPVIGAGLSSFGYPLLFGASGLLIGCYTLVALRWLPETRPTEVSGPAEGPGAAGRLAGAVPPGVTADQPVDGPDARIRRLVFAAFLPLLGATHALTFLWVTTLPIYAARDLRLPTPAWGLLFGLNGLIIVLFQLRVSAAVEARSKPMLIAGAMLLYAAGLGLVVLLAPESAFIGLAATIALITLGEILVAPVIPAFIAELSPVDRRGTYQGIALAATGIGSAIGPPVAGLALDAAPGQVLWFTVAMMLVGLGAGYVGLARYAATRLPGDTQSLTHTHGGRSAALR